MDKIEVKDAVKKYGKVVAVDKVSLKVQEREILSLLGPSGCGKTTILRAIAGLEELDEGDVLIDNQLVTSTSKGIFVPPEKRGLGLVFQSYALWPHMTVAKNIAYGLEIKKFSKQDIAQKIKSVLELVELSGLENRYPSQLSGGQQQRVALARNLVYEPSVILLDEPLSNLDLKVRERTRGELHSLLKRIGITAVYVTHDQEEAFVISDRVILMKDGHVVQDATPRQIYEEPANLFVADFIGRANLLKANVVTVDEKSKTAELEVPEMRATLLCQYECPTFPQNLSMIILRHNEMGLYETKPNFTENVFKAEVLTREYRGAITDHKIRVGDCNLIVTTHKFTHMQGSLVKKEVYLHIPPEAIKPIPCEADTVG